MFVLIVLSSFVSAEVVHYYSFDSNANDEVGTANGVVNGATNQALGCKNNNCYEFDGSGDYINFSDSLFANIAGSYTFCMWIEQDTLDGYVLTEGTWNANEPLMFRVDSDVRFIQTVK